MCCRYLNPNDRSCLSPLSIAQFSFASHSQPFARASLVYLVQSIARRPTVKRFIFSFFWLWRYENQTSRRSARVTSDSNFYFVVFSKFRDTDAINKTHQWCIGDAMNWISSHARVSTVPSPYTEWGTYSMVMSEQCTMWIDITDGVSELYNLLMDMW